MGFYYPEGYFGPVCDSPVSDSDIQNRSRPAIKDDPDKLVTVINGMNPDDFDYITGLIDPSLPFYIGKDCKVDKDGNWYDCEDKYIGGDIGSDDGPFPLPGFTDDFFIPDHEPDQCTRGDSDINIRPRVFYNDSGTQVTKYSRQKSSPVTFPVWSEVQEISTPSGTLSASFSSSASRFLSACISSNERTISFLLFC